MCSDPLEGRRPAMTTLSTLNIIPIVAITIVMMLLMFSMGTSSSVTGSNTWYKIKKQQLLSSVGFDFDGIY